MHSLRPESDRRVQTLKPLPGSTAVTDGDGRAIVMCPEGEEPAVVILGGDNVRADERGGMMRLPAVGGLDLHIVTEEKVDGETVKEELAQGMLVHFRILDERDRLKRLCELIEVADGHWTTPCVAIGERFRVQLKSSAFLGIVDFDGPQVPGEVISVELVARRKGRVDLRVVDETGQPLRGRRLRISLTYFGSVHGPHVSDASGRVQFYPPDLEDTRELAGVLIRESGLRNSALQGEVRPHEPIQRPASGEALDLGDVVMRPPDLLVSGRVTDADGKPVRRASVYLVSEEAGAPGPLVSGTLQEPEWPLPGEPIHCRTALDGSFELHCVGDPTAGGERSLALFAHRKDQMAVAEVPFEVGDSDVRLVLGETGRILLDTADLTNRDLGGIEIALRGEDEAFEPRWIQAGRTKWFDRLVPGEYRVTLTLDGHMVDLAKNIMVGSGQDVSDPRLVPLTLEPAVERRSFRLSGPGAEEVRQIYLDRSARMEQPSREPSRQALLESFAPVSLVAVEGEFSVPLLRGHERQSWEMDVPGHRRVHLASLDDGMVIELEPPIEVELRIVSL
ncbi:MAG: hypothetical protein AAGG01_22285, partial [Planctomycetota bacterium]